MERAAALRTRAFEELRRLSTVAEPDSGPAEQQCDHFSIRGYVALLQKKDPKLYSLSQIFCEQKQHDEHHNVSPLSVAEFRRWNCSNCLDKMKSSDRRTTSRTVSVKQDGTNDGCSISFVRTITPTIVDSRRLRLFPCTQQSSRGINADASAFSKSAQECNSRCNSPSGSKGVLTEVNVDPATKELQGSPNNLDVMARISNDVSVDVADFPGVPQMIPCKAGNGTKVLQVSPDNLEVMANISNDVSVDGTDVPDVRQMISSKAGNGRQNPGSPNPCEVPNEDEIERTEDVQNDCNASNVPKSGPKGPKPISGPKGSQVRIRGPRLVASKRNAVYNSKKEKNKSIDMSAISDVKVCQRKPKKTRLISELIDTDQVEGVVDAMEVDHASIAVLSESDKGKMSLEVENDNDTQVSNQKVDEIQSRTFQNKTQLRVDDVDDGSSLMNWLKITHKKVRTKKKDSGHKHVHSSSVVSNSTPDIPASKDMHHDILPSVRDLNQKEVLSTTSAKHGNENTHNYNLERNIQKANDLCKNVPGNSNQKFLSKGKSTVLIKRKALPTANAQHSGENTENCAVKRNMLKADDLCQMASENTVKRCLTKVPLGKRNIHNVSGLHDQKMPKDKKKRKLEVHEKPTVIDDIPMDIVEVLARNQRERQLMTDTVFLENSHTRPKVTADDHGQITAKDGSIDTSTVHDTNFQKSVATERKQKSLPGHASLGTEAASLHPLEELHMQKSLQGHVASITEAPNGNLSKLQMHKPLPIHTASITEAVNVYPPKLHIPDLLKCTQEQETHVHMDDEVTIACTSTSPAFSHHQHIAEVPVQSWSNKGTKKLMWDSFKTASRNSPTPTYGSQFRHSIREVDSASTYVSGASNSYPTHQPLIAAVDHYTNKAVNQVQPRSFQSTVSTMGVDRLYDQRIAGRSGLYPNEAMPATHFLRLMDSSTASGFTNYETPHRNQMELQAFDSQCAHNQYKTSSSTSYGSHNLIGKAPMTLQDLSRHQVHQNLHRPLRPHPRVGVLGSLLQQDIANWSENCGTHSAYGLGVSKGIASFDMNRKESYDALNSGMFSARWNALQLGSVSPAANPDYPLPRYGVAQSWSRGDGRMVHPLDKLVRKDICATNSNPADFTAISDTNEYMINL